MPSHGIHLQESDSPESEEVMGSAKFLGMGSNYYRSAVEKMIDLVQEDLLCSLSDFFPTVLSPISYDF